MPSTEGQRETRIQGQSAGFVPWKFNSWHQFSENHQDQPSSTEPKVVPKYNHMWPKNTSALQNIVVGPRRSWGLHLCLVGIGCEFGLRHHPTWGSLFRQLSLLGSPTLALNVRPPRHCNQVCASTSMGVWDLANTITQGGQGGTPHYASSSQPQNEKIKK